VDVAKIIDIVGDAEVDAIGTKKGIYGYSRCEIELKNGEIIRGESDAPLKGFPENPMTREERLNKYYGQALMVLSQEQADQVVECIETIEEMDDIRPLMRLLVSQSGTGHSSRRGVGREAAYEAAGA